jgi:hypothetical protein
MTQKTTCADLIPFRADPGSFYQNFVIFTNPSEGGKWKRAVPDAGTAAHGIRNGHKLLPHSRTIDGFTVIFQLTLGVFLVCSF